MKRINFSPGLIASIILALIFIGSLLIRVYLPHGLVFSGEWIKFTEVDAYYHMRLVDNLLSNFPHRLAFDPYTLYPSGHVLFWPPLYDWLLAGVSWIAGLGSPSQHLVDMVCIYFPAFIGALTIIPVYFIGKELFNHWVGLISAGLIALIPGFLNISTLGYTDHHVAETFFSTIAFLFLILAIKTASEKKLNFGNLKSRNWAILGKPLIYSLLTGLFLGTYLLTAPVGLVLIFLIFVFFVVQFIINHLKNQRSDYLVLVSTAAVAIAAIISLPLLPHQSFLYVLYLPSLLITFLTPFVLAGVSRFLRGRQTRPVYYPLAIVALGLVGVGIIYFVNPSLLLEILEAFGQFFPSEIAGATIAETRPLLTLTGEFTFYYAWIYFTTGLFMGLIALGLLSYKAVKQGDAQIGLLVVWSLVMLAATLGQNRFSHYFAVNAAILSGYLSWQIYRLISSMKINIRGTKSVRKKREKRGQSKKPLGTKRLLTNTTLGITAIFLLAFLPNIWGAISITKWLSNVPSDAWYQALEWFKDNSPEPFGEADTYYQLYQLPETGEYHYPDSAYSVVSWVDYGHWITRIAHRIPVASPFQHGIGNVSEVLIAQDELSANSKMDTIDSKYIIIDGRTLDFLPLMTTWVTGEAQQLYDIYYDEQMGSLWPVPIYYPELYRTLAVHLFLFDGGEVSEEKPRVVSYVEKRNSKGQLYKEITELKSFPSYEEAKAYISIQESGNHRIVSLDPFVSPVPIEALKDYELIFKSEMQVSELANTGFITEQMAGQSFPAVKIFEYLK